MGWLANTPFHAKRLVMIHLKAIAETAQPRAIGWISLQTDGSISVGLNDRAFISPKFRDRKFLWNFYNRVTLEYMVSHSPDTLEPVLNPHLTFHPPIYFHLRANGEEELFAGIAEPRLMLDESETVPWLRFVSKPISDLSAAGASRSPEKTTIIIETIVVPVSDCSIGLRIDFVRPDHSENPDSLWGKHFVCREHRIYAFAELLPPQLPTLVWYHQC